MVVGNLQALPSVSSMFDTLQTLLSVSMIFESLKTLPSFLFVLNFPNSTFCFIGVDASETLCSMPLITDSSQSLLSISMIFDTL